MLEKGGGINKGKKGNFIYLKDCNFFLLVNPQFFSQKKNFNIAAVVFKLSDSVNEPVTGRNSPVPGLTGIMSGVEVGRSA